MRILHVIPYFVPAYSYGGPVTVCFDMAAMQVSLGHSVTVVTTDTFEAGQRVPLLRETLAGIEVVRFRNVSAHLSKLVNLYTPIGLATWARDNIGRFDVVHMHDYFTYLNVIVGRACRRAGIPYLLQPHGVAAPPPTERLFRVKQAFGALWGRELLESAACVVAVGDYERQRVAAYAAGAKLVLVGNGVQLDEKRVGRDRRAFGLRDGDKVLLSMGRLHATKGFDRLLRAFAVLVRRDREYQLLIAGSDNGAEADLRAQIHALGLEREVQLLGWVKDERKARAFATADLFVLLSRYESFAITVIESLAHGLPACLSKEVGVAEQLVPLGCATIVRDADDAEATADDLAHAFARRAELAAHAQPAAERFDVRAVVDKVLSLYVEATSPARTATQ